MPPALTPTPTRSPPLHPLPTRPQPTGPSTFLSILIGTSPALSSLKFRDRKSIDYRGAAHTRIVASTVQDELKQFGADTDKDVVLRIAILCLISGCNSLLQAEHRTVQMTPEIRHKLKIRRRISDTTLRTVLRVESRTFRYGKLTESEDRTIVSSLPASRLTPTPWLRLVRLMWGRGKRRALHPGQADARRPASLDRVRSQGRLDRCAASAHCLQLALAAALGDAARRA